MNTYYLSLRLFIYILLWNHYIKPASQKVWSAIRAIFFFFNLIFYKPN